MNDQLPDKTVLIIILATLLIVFFLIFSFKSKRIEQEKRIQWMDSSINYDFISPNQKTINPAYNYQFE